MKIYSIISLVILLAINSFAQIVLGPERLAANGDKITTKSMEIQGVDEGASGANQTWNYSGLASFDELVMEYVDASTTPFHSSFPTATLAGVVSEGEIASYTYYSVVDNKLLAHGTNSGDFSSIYSDPEIVASYPFSFNSSFNDNFQGQTDLGDGFFAKKNGSISAEGDAYGTITLPDGSVHNTLRVRTEHASVDSMFMDEIFFGETILSSESFIWYIAGVKHPIFSISYISTQILGNTIVSKSVQFSPLTPTDVNEEDPVLVGGYELEQNFPNPFNPSTKISYTLNEKSFITLKVYNVIGKEVAVLENGEKEAGIYNVNFDASGFSAGVYFYTLSSNNFQETKKMILLK